MKAIKFFVGVCLVAVLVACGGGGGDPVVRSVTGVDAAPTTSENASVAKFTLTPSAKTLKADGKDSITWTIYALTAGNASVKGAKIDLSANNGVILGAAQVTTTETGATVTMIADPTDQRNRTVTLTATCTGCTVATSSTTSDISVTGAVLTLANTPDSNLVVGSSTGATLKATLKDATGAVMPGVSLNFANTDALVLSLSTATGTTDSTGSVSVTVNGRGAGKASIDVSGLGAVASQAYTSASPANALTINKPVSGASHALGGADIPVEVSAPGSTTIVFNATSGRFDKTTVNVANGIASSTFTPSQAGTVTITVSDGQKTSSTNISVSPPVSAVTKILLNASQTTLPLSTDGVVQSIKITATALTDLNQAVANVPVSFTWSGGPGAGERLSPALAFTDASGKAEATFTAGTASSTANNIKVNAQYFNTSKNLLVSTGTAPSSNDVALTIGGSALSVSFGAASVLIESSDKTRYTSAYSVQVTDANNNPVANQLVTLRLQPVAFSLGTACNVTSTYCSEDRNRNGSKDEGEDGVRVAINTDATKPDLSDVSRCTDTSIVPETPLAANKDTFLTPNNSDGGSVPSTVTTDKDGIAAFNLIYLKGRSLWVVNQLTATVSSNGTETSTSTIFRLSASEADVKPPVCFIPDSPYK